MREGGKGVGGELRKGIRETDKDVKIKKKA